MFEDSFATSQSASSIPAATSNHPQPVSTQQLFGNNQQQLAATSSDQ